MYTRDELFAMRQGHCDWHKQYHCTITDFDKCKKCKALHVKPLGLESIVLNGFEGIQKLQHGARGKLWE